MPASMNNLPVEIIVKIIAHLPPMDLALNVRNACVWFRYVVDHIIYGNRAILERRSKAHRHTLHFLGASMIQAVRLNEHHVVGNMLLAASISPEYGLSLRHKMVPALFIAANFGYPEIIQSLLQHRLVHPSAIDGEGNTALILACRYDPNFPEGGKLAVVRLLLSSGMANVNARNMFGHTALSKAIVAGYSSIVRALTDAMDIMLRGTTALHMAMVSTQANPDIVETLVRSGKVDLNEVDAFGNTALHMGVLYNRLDMVRALIGNGAHSLDFFARDPKNQMTPLDTAHALGRGEIVQLVSHVQQQVYMIRATTSSVQAIEQA